MHTFPAMLAFSEMGSFLFPLAIMGMGMSIPIIAIITEHLQKKERMRLIEKAIEHGADLKDLNLEDLNSDGNCKPRLPYRSGMILIATGIALSTGNYFLDVSFGSIHIPLLIGGLITGLIGVAQILNDWINRGRLGGE